jgi:PRC-barrel domain
MSQSTHATRLRYLDAQDVDDSIVDFDGLNVRGRDDQKLGDIDGFIVNADSGRVYYIVVDSGGWFTSQRFLLPVGHAVIDRDRAAIRVDFTQDALKRYPKFEEERFLAFTDEELQTFDSMTATVCCPDEVVAAPAGGALAFESRRHFTQPEWWRRSGTAVPGSRASVTASEDHETGYQDDRDVSPHVKRRAQPGDILGIETAGETTEIGDTAEDENERRRKLTER